MALNSLSSTATQQQIAQNTPVPLPVKTVELAEKQVTVTPQPSARVENASQNDTVSAEEDPVEEQTLATETDAAGTSKQFPMNVTLTLQSGDTLSTLLEQLDVASEESHAVVSAVRKHYNPKKLAVGQDINIHLDSNPEDSELAIVKSMQIPLSVISSLEITRKSDNGFDVKKHDAEINRTPVHVSGKITSSLYETGVAHGIPARIISNIINAYSYDVDFQREIRKGDKISVLFEKLQTENGDTAGSGDVLFAKLHTGNRIHTIYRYVDKSGDADFYNAKGESVRKGLLRTPINGARITSTYGMRRHPILGYSKMHKGVDFGAARGTPIYAAGDGIVNYAGRKGGYGNYLRIKHNQTYATAYAHIHRFASGITNGKKVKQGQIVAYVGSTGRSTGPHLHYEVHKNGRQVNPSGVKFKTGNVLAGAQLKKFKQHVSQIDATVANLSKDQPKLALLDKRAE